MRSHSKRQHAWKTLRRTDRGYSVHYGPLALSLTLAALRGSVQRLPWRATAEAPKPPVGARAVGVHPI